METIVIRVLLVLVIGLGIADVGLSKEHQQQLFKKKRSSAVVVGTVYCDTCFKDVFSKSSSHYISGASVAVECAEGESKPNFRQEVKTNDHGEFRVKLPFSVSKHVKNIKRCSVELLSSSEPYCSVASSATSSSLRRLKSANQETWIFSAGFFTFKPENQPEICGQKPIGLQNSKIGFPDPSFPPPTKDPSIPDPSPLPLIPQLPPLPSLPLIPTLPPILPKSASMSDKKPSSLSDKKPPGSLPDKIPVGTAGFFFPPIPGLQPPSLIPPNPLVPPPSFLPPNPLQPPPAPVIPTIPPLPNVPPVPGVTPPSPPTTPILPFPIPPITIPPIFPGIPPASPSSSAGHRQP